MDSIAHYANVEPGLDNPAWAEIIERCVDLHRHYRISPWRADLIGGKGVLSVPGRFGRAGRFDGHSTGHRVELPEALVDAPRYTLMSWVWVDPEDSREQELWTDWDRGHGFRVHVDPQEEQLRIRFRQTEPERWQERAGTALAAGTWRHIAITRTPERIGVYVDGARRIEIPAEPAPSLRSTLHLGRHHRMTSRHFNGRIDEFRVLDDALDTGEIEAEMARDAAATEAVVHESFDELPAGAGSPYTAAGEADLKAWFRFWRSEGLHLGNVTAPSAYKYNRMDFRTADAFFSRYYPYLESQGWLPFTYTRMPVDEATTGRGLEVNRAYGEWLGEHYPGLNRHHTIGDKIEDDRLEDEIKAYAGAIDIWDFTPGIWTHRGEKAVEWIKQRGEEHGDRIAWYLTRSSPISRGRVIQPLGLRGFFWQMVKHDVNMVNHWNATIWNRPHGLEAAERNVVWRADERAYRFHATTAAGVASATLLWPSADGPLPSMRWAAIRDGIENFDLWHLVQEGAAAAQAQDVTVKELDEVLAWKDAVPVRYVGLRGFSTDFGGPAGFRERRAQLVRVAERLHEAGLLPEDEALPEPPATKPWRRFLDGQP